MLISCSQTFVELPSGHRLHITTWTLSMKIVPGEKDVQIVVALTLSDNILYPCFLHLLIGENAEEHIDFVDVKIQHDQLYQQVVGHVVDRVVVVAPQAVLLLELLYEIGFDRCLNLLLR